MVHNKVSDMRPYFGISIDCSEFFFKSKQSIFGLQQPFELAGVLNTPCVVYVTFLKYVG